MRQAFLIIYIFAVIAAALNAEESRALSGWMPSKDCSLEMRGGEFVVTSTGIDPYLVALQAGDLSKAKGPFTVELLMALKSKGRAQIYWSPPENAHAFSAGSVATFDVLHDGEWHVYSVKLDTTALGGLRIDPSTAPGEIRIATVLISDGAGKLLKEWNLGAGGPPKEFPNASGNAQIRGTFKDSEIVITTTQRLAGAIHSLTWNGKEFVNSVDHGRQLQSASNFDCGTRMTGETYNPTEAGSRDDGAGPFSSSRLLGISAVGAELKTTTQMAFWLKPGENSGGELAKNTTVLSQHLLSKRVHIGHKELGNVIEYEVTFKLPDEHHNHGIFEALTGYMPFEFGLFFTLDPATRELKPISNGDGQHEQALPLIFSTTEKGHAMGIFAPDQQPGGLEKPSYGRFKFVDEKVVKWNCVYRERDTARLKPGDLNFRMYVALGSLDDVKTSMEALFKEFEPGR